MALTVASAAWSVSTPPQTAAGHLSSVTAAPATPAPITPAPGTTAPVTTGSPTSTVAAITVPTPTSETGRPETADLGGTLVLSAVDDVNQATPGVATEATLGVTLDHVIDPGPPTPGTSATPGDRFVELVFAIANKDPQPFTDEQTPYYPPLTFAVDNSAYANESGAQPLPHEGYDSVDGYSPSPPGPCTSFLTIAPGQTRTGCVGFQLPAGVPVVLASVALTLGDSEYGSLGEWRIPPPATRPTAGPVAPGPSLAVAGLGGTVTLTVPDGADGTLVVRMTLDRIVDPAPATSPGLLPGDRAVALAVTIANVGTATVPCYEGYKYQPTLLWSFDSDPDTDGGYTAQGLPSEACAGVTDTVQNGLAPGTSVTGDIPVDMPVGVPVANAVVGLVLAGAGGGSQGEWLIA